jgi:hypothetical protein
MTIRCFLLEPTGRTVRQLRRYSPTMADATASDPARCPGMGYHNARAPLDVVEGQAPSGDSWPHDDPRWPKQCDACGYQFTDADAFQVFAQAEMRRSDTNTLTTIRDAPVGAMWWATWLAGHFEGADQTARRQGQSHLIVKTPGGDWDIDAPSNNGTEIGPGWTREGKPPHVTARPSILMVRSGYHGWLTDGALVDC